MGRPSSTNFPYLIQRAEGWYVYNRVLPADIAPYVAGDITLEWSYKIVRLNSQKVIKISFRTADLAAAKERWPSVHVQIEALVRCAMARVRTRETAEMSKMLSSLQPTSMRQMAGQAHHDILAADDRSWSDAGFATPTAQIALKVLQRAGHAASPGTFAQAQQVAQNAEARIAEAHLKNRNIRLFDQKIVEGEIEIDDDMREAILSTAFVAGEQRLTKSAHDALNVEPAKPVLIPSHVDAILADNGVDLPTDNPDRHKLALAILRAEVNAYRTVIARRDGDTTETPERPTKIELPLSCETVSSIHAHWITEVQPGKKERDDTALYVRLFIEIYGDIAIVKVTKKMVIDFRDTLAKCPRNLTKVMAKAPLAKQIAWAETEKRRLLSRQTVNAKGVGTISAIMKIAIKRGDLSINVCDGTLFDVAGAATPRLPYDVTDLNAIFAMRMYTEGKRWVGGAEEAQFWFPLIGPFAGARLEEIGQLLTDDIRWKGTIVYFAFTEIDDEAERTGSSPVDKTMKTPNSRRLVPIHPFLIEIGFLNYVGRMRATGHRRLFPALVAYDEKLTHNWSKWWGRRTDEDVTKSPHKVFHSLRHNFSDQVREITGGNEEVVSALIGHKKHMYGSSISLELRHKIICQIKYHDVDFSHVRREAQRLTLC